MSVIGLLTQIYYNYVSTVSMSSSLYWNIIYVPSDIFMFKTTFYIFFITCHIDIDHCFAVNSSML